MGTVLFWRLADATAVYRRGSLVLAFLFGIFAVTSQSARADAVTVTYSASQEMGSLWQYSYSVTGTVSAGDDIAIYFPLASSSSLNDLGTGGTDWATFVYQPDAGLPADGEFDLRAKVTDPSFSPLFTVSFLYSGTTPPGSQAFTLYDSGYQVLETGQTVPAGVSTVPEPGTMVLFGSGLAGLAGVWRRHTSRR